MKLPRSVNTRFFTHFYIWPEVQPRPAADFLPLQCILTSHYDIKDNELVQTLIKINSIKTHSMVSRVISLKVTQLPSTLNCPVPAPRTFRNFTALQFALHRSSERWGFPKSKGTDKWNWKFSRGLFVQDTGSWCTERNGPKKTEEKFRKNEQKDSISILLQV
jgi:hypothetical protein